MKVKILINNKEWFTYQQLARKLGVSIKTIFNRLDSGLIESIKVDGVTLYREVDE